MLSAVRERSTKFCQNTHHLPSIQPAMSGFTKQLTCEQDHIGKIIFQAKEDRGGSRKGRAFHAEASSCVDTQSPRGISSQALGASMHVHGMHICLAVGGKGEGTRGKTGKGRLNPDRIGFWSPSTKRFGFHPVSNRVKRF